jgi:hypothetical protein
MDDEDHLGPVPFEPSPVEGVSMASYLEMVAYVRRWRTYPLHKKLELMQRTTERAKQAARFAEKFRAR